MVSSVNAVEDAEARMRSESMNRLLARAEKTESFTSMAGPGQRQGLCQTQRDRGT